MTTTLIACEVVLLSITDFLIRVPNFKIFFDFQRFHRHVVADSPGTPHGFDNELISLYNTLPEPSDFDIIWTDIPYAEPLLLRGRVPIARINSISVYSRPGKANFPTSMDLASIVDEYGFFEVIIARSIEEFKKLPQYSKATFLCSRDWDRGFVVMRNYLIPPGTLVYTPQIIRVRDKCVIRESEQLITGPAYMENIYSLHESRKFYYRCAILALVTSVNHFLFKIDYSWSVVGIFVAVAISKLLCQLMFYLGKRRIQQHIGFCKEPHKFYSASDTQAAEGSQPSALHAYWVMRYDLPPNGEVLINGIINPSDQQFWSLILYDPYGVPLPQFVNDQTVKRRPVPSESADGITNDPDAYEFHVRIRRKPVRGPYTDEDATDASVIDVSNSPSGIILFRRVHPATTQGSHAKIFAAGLQGTDESQLAPKISDRAARRPVTKLLT